MNLRKLYYKLPPGIRLLARKLVYLPHDLRQSLSGNKQLMPPKGMIYTGGGDFIATGNRFLEYFKIYGRLQPDHDVLDIGSGIGRMAIPLTTYLSEKASYNGFDVMKVGVKWCTENITARYHNFIFKYIDLANDLYKNSGQQADTFKFPYPSESIDFCLLISVFTHMSPEEIFQYLTEIHKVLRPGGRCFATFFLYDNEEELTATNFAFPHKYDFHALMDDKVSSANVAIQYDVLLDKLAELNLILEHRFQGGWKGGEMTKDFQDILVFSKPNVNS